MTVAVPEEKTIHLPGGGTHIVGARPRVRKPRVYRAGSTRTAKQARDLRQTYERLQLEGLTPAQLAIGGPTITAAATRIEKATSQDLRRLIQPWQARAMAYYDMIGEVWFSSQFYSRTLAKVRLFPAILDDNGDPQESDDPTLQALWARVQDPSGGRSELQASYGRLMFLIGEGYLIVSPDPDWGEVWEFLSPNELRVQPGGVFVRYRAPQIGTEEYYNVPEGTFEPIEGLNGAPDQIVPWRLWRKHPSYCADDQTEILTEHGWKTHDKLRVGEKVLTLNHETGMSEWNHVQAVNRFQVEDEEMLSLEGRSHSSLTTLEHRWPVLRYERPSCDMTRQWKTSADVDSNDRIISAAVCADLPRLRTFDDSFVEAVAWFYTEGHISKRYKSAQVSIAQSSSANPQYVNRIRAVLTARHGPATTTRMSTGKGPLAPPKWREYEAPNNPGKIDFWLNTAASAELLDVAPNKVVSLDFIRSLTLDQLELFIEVSIAADGHKTQFAQKDPDRVAAFELACILTGRTVHTTTTHGRCDMRSVSISPKRHLHVTSAGRRPTRSSNMRPERVGYTGTVWCPTTKNRTWVARRNGTVYYTGNSWWSDGPLHATLDILEEILLLTLAVRSKAKSRAANSGILLWPDEMSLPQLDASGDEDPLNDPFFEEFAANYLGPINDPGSASGGVPLFVRMAASMIPENAGGPRYMDFSANDAYNEQGIRNELIRRFALGVDLPPSQLLGPEASNHWTEWLVDEQSWKAHLMPVTQQMCNDFGSAYLRPAARDEDFPNWQKVVVGYDATEVINHPDRGKDAKDLFDDGALSEKAYREAKGFDETDAPSQKERARYIGIKVRDSSLAWDEIPSIKAGGIEPEPGDIENAQGQEDEPTGAKAGNEVEKGPPAASGVKDDTHEPITGSAASISHERIIGAAESALDRCRELAGSRIVTRVKNQRCEECLDQIDGKDQTLIAAALGAEKLGELKLVPLKLVEGGARSFARNAGRHGLTNGYGSELADAIEAHAAETLFEPEPLGLPESFSRILEAIRD